MDPHTPPKALFEPPQTWTFFYKNYEGREANRRVRVTSIEYTCNKYHPEPQWLANGVDLETGKVRAFAMKDMAHVRNASKKD